MKIWIAAMLWLPVTCLHGQRMVNNFEDIQFWAGTGTNRAALVLEFTTGGAPVSVAWGYRWNGSAVMQNMIFALAGSITGSSQAPPPLAGSDPRLSADVGFFTGLGFYVQSLNFDARGLGGLWPNSQLRIQDDYDLDETYAVVYWRPGNGIWTAQPFGLSANDGIPTLALQNNGWFGIVQGKGTGTYSFVAPFAAPSSIPGPVPVPSTRIERTGAGATVSFVSTAGFNYQLQVKDTLATAGWTNLGAAVAGNGQHMAMTDTTASSRTNRFYRVLISR